MKYVKIWQKKGFYFAINNIQIAVFLFGFSFIAIEFAHEIGQNFPDKKTLAILRMR